MVASADNKPRWPLVRLGDVCEIIGGGTPSKENKTFYQGNIPWATVRDMRNDFISTTEYKITEQAVRSSSTNIIPSGNIIIATRVGLGKVSILTMDTAINQDLRGVVPIKMNNLDVKYLFYWFKSIAHVIINEGTGATVQGVKLPFIKNLPIPLPPLAEQQRIVARLDAAFAAIDEASAAAEANLRNARALFDSYLDQVFSARGDWQGNYVLNELCEFIVDCEHKTAPTELSGFPLIRTPNIGRNKLLLDQVYFVSKKTYDSWTRRAIPKAGDLILAREAPAGNVVVIPDNINVCLGQRTVLIRPQKTQISSHFLAWLLITSDMQNKLLAHSRGATVAHVNMKDIRSLLIGNLPDMNEQNKITQQLSLAQSECESLVHFYTHKLTLLAELKQALLAEEFGGG